MRIDKLSRQNLCKLAVRLQAKFKLSMSECCPNIRREKCTKNIRYLIYRRYVERSMEYDPWQEVVDPSCIHLFYNVSQRKLNFNGHVSTNEVAIFICRN